MANDAKNVEVALPPVAAPSLTEDDSPKADLPSSGDNTSAPLASRIPPPAILGDLTEEELEDKSRSLVRKIDIRLLPAIVIMYILNYIDRNNIAAARLGGLEEDLGLKGVEYQTCVSILFVGYVLMQIPSNLYMNKLGKPALYLPICMIIWGVISAATAACTGFGGLLAVRFFLGFVEAAYFPGCLYYLSCWYTRKELGFRTAVLYSGALISGAFSGLIAAGVTGNMDGTRGMRAWKWLFIIEGVATVAIAFGCFFVLPNFPRTTMWLTEEERALAVWRLQADIGEDDWIDSEQQTFWNGAKLAFMDMKTYILLLIVFCIISSGSVTNFFPTVVATLKFGRVESLLLTSPPYILSVITTFLVSWHADKTGERFWHITIPLLVAVVAFVIAATTTSIGPRYLSMMLMVPSVYPALVVAFAWISNTLPRPPAKRAAALAFINAFGNASSIYASYMYPSSAGPQYRVAFAVCGATAGVAILGAGVLKYILVRLNKQLDQGIYVEGAINALPGEGAHHGFRFKV